MKILFLSLSLALLTLSCDTTASEKSSSADLDEVAQLAPTTTSQELDSIATPQSFYDTTIYVLYPKRQGRKMGTSLTRERLNEYGFTICDYEIPIYGDVAEIWFGDRANDCGFGVGFDARGNISNISYASDCISDSTDELWRSYTYDNTGRLIGQEAECYNGHIQQDLDAKYDSRGNITEMNIWASLWKTGRVAYKYDSKDNITEVDYDGYRTIYKYDSSSNKIMKLEYDYEDRRVGKTTCKYDANDNLVMSLKYDSNDSLAAKHLYHYNSKGDMCKVTTYYSDQERDAEIISDIEYDSRGNLIKCGPEIIHTITYCK